MDKIVLSGMEFFGYHGVLPEEKRSGQPFIVTVEMYLDLEPAGRSDDLTRTVNYAEAFEKVKEITEQKRFDLIEALAEAIADELLINFQIEKVTVIIDKPQAPLPGKSLGARVEITRGEK